MPMPTYKFSEIQMSNFELDEFATTDGLWEDYSPILIDFDHVKIVAKEVLTDKQYQVFLLRSAGFTFNEIAELLGTTQQNCVKKMHAGIKKLKIYYK